MLLSYRNLSSAIDPWFWDTFGRQGWDRSSRTCSSGIIHDRCRIIIITFDKVIASRRSSAEEATEQINSFDWIIICGCTRASRRQHSTTTTVTKSQHRVHSHNSVQSSFYQFQMETASRLTAAFRLFLNLINDSELWFPVYEGRSCELQPSSVTFWSSWQTFDISHTQLHIKQWNGGINLNWYSLHNKIDTLAVKIKKKSYYYTMSLRKL